MRISKKNMYICSVTNKATEHEENRATIIPAKAHIF